MNQNLQVPSQASEKFSKLALSQGKRARLWRLLYGSGPKNGSLLVLPLDQGLEHGPTDFFPHPPAVDPGYQFELAAPAAFLPSRWASAWPRSTWPSTPVACR